jgi:plasmid stabilization system protein ParE
VSISFRPRAIGEIDGAREWYAIQDPDLETRFVAALELTLRRIASFPGAGRPVGAGARAVVLRHFPYQVVYETSGRDITILAVAHYRREPGTGAIREPGSLRLVHSLL